jgi:hypothetical protein
MLAELATTPNKAIVGFKISKNKSQKNIQD